MNRVKRSMLACLPLILLVIPLLTAGSAQAASLACGAWSVAKSPSPGAGYNQLNAVATLSANDIWAVGMADQNGVVNLFQTLTEHWNGTSWSLVKSANVGSDTGALNGVAAVSANNIWAVGYYNPSIGVDHTLIEHWNGTNWSVVSSPNPGSTNGGVLYAVGAVSASDIWAVGVSNYNGNPQKTLIEHWNGTSWSVVTSPNPGGSPTTKLAGIAVVSANDIWAVGYYSTPGVPQTLTEHWNGTSWSIIASPNPAGSGSVNVLNGVTAVSTGDVWAVGYYVGRKGFQTLVEHWNGSSWRVVPSPNVGGIPFIENHLQGVATVSTSDVWAVGYEGNLSDQTTVKTLIEHWNGTSWSIVSSPSPGPFGNYLYAVARVAGSGKLWAVGTDGSSATFNAPKTLIESYC